jgi:hypothetical protein
MKYLVFACVATVSLSGCGNLANVRSYSTAYAEPASGETARLRVITNGMVRAVPARDCIDWRSPGAGVMVVAQSGFAHRNGQNLGMPVSRGDAQLQSSNLVRSELKIPANTPVSFNFQSQGSVSSGYSYSCQESFRFTPQAGKDYQLILLESGQCQISLQRLDSTDGQSNVAYEEAGLCKASDSL